MTVHFTPTHSSWTNAVEVQLSTIERPAVHRGIYRSVKDPGARIRQIVAGRNNNCHPIIWIATAEETVKKANRRITSDA